MIHFILGLSSRNIYLDNLIKNSDKEDIQFFDDTSVDNFLTEIYSGSLFSTPSLLVLKHANKIKDITNLIKSINSAELTDKDIIIDYETNKENKKIKDLSKNFNLYDILDEKENKKILVNYILKRLNCSNKDAQLLLDIIKDDFFTLKNEIDKIEVFLNGENFNFNNIKDILAQNSDFIIFNLTDDILNKKKITFPLKEHMALLASLTNDLEILYRLHICNIKSKNYNSFKEEIKNIELLNSYSPYYIFKKIQYMNNFSKERILKLLKLAFNTELSIKNGLMPLEDSIDSFVLEIINS